MARLHKAYTEFIQRRKGILALSTNTLNTPEAMEEELGVASSPPSLLPSPIINLLHNAPIAANVLSVNLCVLVLLVMRLLIRVTVHWL